MIKTNPFLIVLFILILVTAQSSFSQAKTTQIISQSDSLRSSNLLRNVKLSIVRPTTSATTPQPWSVLLVFDGQDFPAVRVEEALGSSSKAHEQAPLLIVGIHADQDRIFEYGTASQPDYANRGNKAGQTTSFVLEELIPYLKKNYPLSSHRADWAVAGFSLGGLMALDLAWHHSKVFSKVGVFSGSFWWRSRALDDDYDDSDRIMHKIIRQTPHSPDLSFWFQTGTLDETDDRDGDGVIDSIDDTLDLIAELERKKYRWGKSITYVEVPGGEHNQKTWANVFPDFLNWMR